MTKAIERHINDEGWLHMVRQDLDSKAEDWAVKTKVGDIGKLEAICQYLDAILTELDWPSSIHDRPTCGNRHQGERIDHPDAHPKASK